MEERKYFSIRTGRNPNVVNIDLDLLRNLFHATYSSFNKKDYFQEAFGFYCVDVGYISGYVGDDIETFIFKKLRKQQLWPLSSMYSDYTEDDLFDMIELLYDLISKPENGTYHSWNNCGWHYDTFDRDAGRKEFRDEVNDFLSDYQDGWELSENGEILWKGDEGLNNIFKADLPDHDNESVNSKVKMAILKFRRHKSSIEDRKEAVRELADVLEYIRPQIKEEMLSKDENDLFNIANNFCVRHNNPSQKKNYDKAVWLSWMFYVYLAAIHLIIRIVNKDKY